MPNTVKGSCHCGAVSFEIPKPRGPVLDCQCSICRRYGVLWTYYHPDEVTITLADPKTPQATYICNRRDIEFVRCAECGCVTHWRALPGRPDFMMGVNSRMLEREELDRLPRTKSEGRP